LAQPCHGLTMSHIRPLIIGIVIVCSLPLASIAHTSSSDATQDQKQQRPTQPAGVCNQTQPITTPGSGASAKKKHLQMGLPGSSSPVPPLPGAGASSTSSHESVPTAVQLHPVYASASDPAQTKKASLIYAPIPISNQAIGVGVIGIVAYIFPLSRHDEISPPSILGAGGGYVSKGSWGAAGYAQLYLKHDRFRLTGAYGHGDVKLSLYGSGTAAGNTGISVPVSENGDFYFLQGLVRVSRNIFLGARYKISVANILINLTGVAPPQFNLPGLGLHQQAASLGIVSERDTRNSTFYPTRGSDSGFHIDFSEPSLGSTFRYQNYDAYFNKYISLGENQVFAFRAYGCGVSGAIVPFTQLCEFGSNNDIRGYEAGRYRDRLMFAVQSEYRLHLRFPQRYPRFGVVVFGGVGEVAPTFGSFSFGSLLPAGGVGLRYRLSKTFPVNFRLDSAYGKNGGTYMFSIGEAF
jgi:hypothetical protein